MPIGSILFAETDPRALAKLPALLTERLPNIQLEICKTVDDATRNLRRSKFDTVITSTPFLWAQNSRLLSDLNTLHKLVPLVLTVDQAERTRAQESLLRRGFDLITKPIEPDEAVKRFDFLYGKTDYLSCSPPERGLCQSLRSTFGSSLRI